MTDQFDTPAQVPVPGEMLRREIDARGLTQAEFAAIIGRPVQAISEIVTGRKAITPETAHLIAQVFGTSPEFWMNLESRYRLWLTRGTVPRDAVDRRARLFQALPVQEMIKRGWLPRSRDVAELETAACRLIGVSSLAQTPTLGAHLRRSPSREPSLPALQAWLATATARGERIRKAFDARRVKEAIPEIVQLSASADARAVFDALRALGVAVVHLPHLPRTYVDGAATWLGTRPVIVLSLRYRRVDNFWFTLLHEVAHLLLHERKSFIDEDLVGPRAGQDDITEQQADRAAGEWLIPEGEFARWVKHRVVFSAAAIEEFAREVHVHPGIVVGRLQFEQRIPYTHHRKFLVPIQLG